MKKEGLSVSILIIGQAGQGPNVLAKIVGSTIAKLGYYVFISREYGSFIRGCCNSNTLTISDRPVSSNPSKIDILVNLDSSFKPLIKGNPTKIFAKDEDNMYFAGKLIKIFGIDFQLLEKELKTIKNFEQNLKNAKKGYNDSKTKYALKQLSNQIFMANGAQAVAEGAIKSGIDVYYAYPMTPATTLLNELADKQLENKYFVMELESEIGVINTAIGSALTGAKAMVGTSGGGFDLMTEALSLTGQAEIPLVIYLSQRPGPATGLATQTAQGDLNIARHSGHGEFPRLVLAPGNPTESEELTSQAFYFSQKYKIPAIILTDKHLVESIYSFSRTEIPIITKSEKSISLKRYHSYESDENVVLTEDPAIVKKRVEARLKKTEEIKKEIENFKPFKIYGNENSKNIILFWGSTKGALLDALKDINAKAIQVLYLEPLSSKIKSELENAKNILIVENNSTSQLSQLIAEKTGIIIHDKNKILRYDGHPFFSDELRNEIQKRLR